MNSQNIMVKSITHAMSGQKLLERKGIKCFIIRNTDAIARYGCGYGIKVSSNRIDEAVKILTANKIKVAGIMK